MARRPEDLRPLVTRRVARRTDPRPRIRGGGGAVRLNGAQPVVIHLEGLAGLVMALRNQG